MGLFEPPHLILVLVIALLIFGPGKLPELGRALGEGLRELRLATRDGPSPPATGASAAAAAGACPHCGTPAGPMYKFCGACGERVSPTT